MALDQVHNQEMASSSATPSSSFSCYLLRPRLDSNYCQSLNLAKEWLLPLFSVLSSFSLSTNNICSFFFEILWLDLKSTSIFFPLIFLDLSSSFVLEEDFLIPSLNLSPLLVFNLYLRESFRKPTLHAMGMSKTVST